MKDGEFFNKPPNRGRLSSFLAIWRKKWEGEKTAAWLSTGMQALSGISALLFTYTQKKRVKIVDND